MPCFQFQTGARYGAEFHAGAGLPARKSSMISGFAGKPAPAAVNPFLRVRLSLLRVFPETAVNRLQNNDDALHANRR
jgi:hypothetical protein